MNIDEINTRGVDSCLTGKTPCAGLTPAASPEIKTPQRGADSQTGVSTENAPSQTIINPMTTEKRPDRHWYALRTTYGREKKAYDYIVNNNGIAFYPTIIVDKLVKGRIKSFEVSRIPNIFFAYGTEAEVGHFVFDNVNLPFLRFYYRHFSRDNEIAHEPLIIPDRQMESLRIVCAAESEDTIITTADIPKFRTGQRVRVLDGPFAGVEGRVGRYRGQQRVGVVIGDVATAVTAYIPKGMMQNIE